MLHRSNIKTGKGSFQVVLAVDRYVTHQEVKDMGNYCGLNASYIYNSPQKKQKGTKERYDVINLIDFTRN